MRALGLLRSLVDFFAEDLGARPTSLQRVLLQHPELRVELATPPTNIDVRSVVFWHDLGKPDYRRWPHYERGDLLGWTDRGGHYESTRLYRQEFDQIGRLAVSREWTCDLQELHGFYCSKSDLAKFADMDSMAEANCSRLISEISPAQLDKMLAHGLRVLRSTRTTDHFTRFAWDGRLWLANTDGSHHLAAAKYIAARLGLSVPLRGALHTHWLDPVPLASLREDFEIFVLGGGPGAYNAFNDAMRAFRATWFWHDLPRPYDHARAVLLPRAEERSARVARELHAAGIEDLGAFLAALVARQLENAF